MPTDQNGWPTKEEIDPNIKSYWDSQGDLTIGDDLLLCGGRTVVPEELQKETLQKLHEGHQGIVRCRLGPRQLYGGQDCHNS